MIELRAVRGDAWREWRALRLSALEEAPHAFGSVLADWQGAGDTERRWRDRLDDVALNVIAYLDGRPAGMVSGSASGAPGTVELLSMWVAPFARGRGVGDALVEAVLRWAGRQGAWRVVLEVAAGNRPAVGLYLRHGFVDPPPGEPAEQAGRRRLARDLPA